MDVTPSTARLNSRQVLRVTRCQHPPESLLREYEADGSYADCYCVEIARQVSHAEFVAAFYSTPAFKLERALLNMFLSRSATDRDAEELANGGTDSFAIWKVEKRALNQLLLAEFSGNTRSWLMIEASGATAAVATRLFFGSAVVPKQNSKSGKRAFGAAFYSLLWFHRLYSRVLLASAKSKLVRAK